MRALKVEKCGSNSLSVLRWQGNGLSGEGGDIQIGTMETYLLELDGVRELQLQSWTSLADITFFIYIKLTADSGQG